MKMKVIFTIGLVVAAHAAVSQDFESDNWKTYKGQQGGSDTIADVDSAMTDSLSVDSTSTVVINPFKTDSASFDPHSSLNGPAQKKGRYKVNKDSRIDAIIADQGTAQPPNPVMIDGYRVQIFISQDRDETLEAKAKFIQLFPDTPAYDDWSAPNHYVRVGNFRTELEAMKFQHAAKEHFNVATVVECEIQLPPLK